MGTIGFEDVQLATDSVVVLFTEFSEPLYRDRPDHASLQVGPIPTHSGGSYLRSICHSAERNIGSDEPHQVENLAPRFGSGEYVSQRPARAFFLVTVSNLNKGFEASNQIGMTKRGNVVEERLFRLLVDCAVC